MAFSPAPSALIPSWSEDGTDVTFPLASVENLSALIADGATGDSRKVIQALVEHFYAWYSALSAGDKPTKLSIARINRIAGSSDEITRIYTISVVTSVTPESFTVADEPV